MWAAILAAPIAMPGPGTAPRKRPRRARRNPDVVVGKLKAADPFELIRWLARSQPDPRKALAELVQNSLDAGAKSVEITRARERGVPILRIVDDGEGVIPEMERREALTYLATHIGHSRKRNLDPQQRRELLLQGKYGIGLLGFWAIGSELEIRTKVPDQPACLLRLFEDEPRYEIEPLRTRLPLADRYTEVVVRGVHRAAGASLAARRMSEFLAAELRGQLLERDVDVVVRDRIARGRAPKVLAVRPTRFDGEKLDLPESIECPGFSPVRAELYLLPMGEARTHAVSVSSAGTAVYDDLAEMEIGDFRRPPWTADRLSGLLEFPDFQIPPGSRRAVMPDAAAVAFVRAVEGLGPLVAGCLEAAEARAAAAIEADLMRRLERVFRDVPRLAPEYDFFAVRGDAARIARGASADASGAGGEEAGDGASPAGVALPERAPDVDAGEEDDRERGELFPPGPLATVTITPAATKLEPRGHRRLRAVARDHDGRPVTEGVSFAWSVVEGPGTVEPGTGARVEFVADDMRGAAVVEVVASQSAERRTARATIEVAEAGPSSEFSRTGIPEPTFVDLPTASWRSRMNDGSWEVNAGHPDYREASKTARRKLRYLAALLAKEVVVHSFPGPNLSPALERLIGILSITERRLEK